MSATDLWCVACTGQEGRMVRIPARSREHAERMAVKLVGEVQPWTEAPEVHATMVEATDRAFASFGP